MCVKQKQTTKKNNNQTIAGVYSYQKFPYVHSSYTGIQRKRSAWKPCSAVKSFTIALNRTVISNSDVCRYYFPKYLKAHNKSPESFAWYICHRKAIIHGSSIRMQTYNVTCKESRLNVQRVCTQQFKQLRMRMRRASFGRQKQNIKHGKLQSIYTWNHPLCLSYTCWCVEMVNVYDLIESHHTLIHSDTFLGKWRRAKSKT